MNPMNPSINAAFAAVRTLVKTALFAGVLIAFATAAVPRMKRRRSGK